MADRDSVVTAVSIPRLLVPDQPRALMTRPDRYEPTAHRLLDELSLGVLPPGGHARTPSQAP